MSLARRDLLALLIAIGAAIAGVVVWLDGTVDIGLELRSAEGGVFISDVTPDGNAARNFVEPGERVLDLQTSDGSTVARGAPMTSEWGDSFAPPLEAVDSARILSVNTGEVYEGSDGEDVAVGFSIVNRDWLESRLGANIYLVGIGLALGLVVWRFLHHGLAGDVGRRESGTLGAAVAIPFLLGSVIQVGNPVGIYAGYLAPIAVALLIGFGLARLHDDPAWQRTAMAASAVAAGLAVILIVRHMTTPTLSPDEREPIFVLIGAVSVVPAAIAGLGSGRSLREWVSLISLALLPVAALTLILPSDMEPGPPLVLIAGLLGWHLLPIGRVADVITGGFGRVRSGAFADSSGSAPDVRKARDLSMYALLLLAMLLVIAQGSTWAMILGVMLAVAMGLAVSRGFLGAGWTDAAVPLAAATGIPVMLVTYSWTTAPGTPEGVVPTALAALGVAHLVAARHTDPEWRGRLFVLASGLVVGIVILSVSGSTLALPLVGLVALIPGVPVAFADRPGDPQAIAGRLETLAVALTPGAAATVLLQGGGELILGGWLAALTVWRYFTLGPLVVFAQRTQLQRDLAVAAAETERARLAADLHDDALQQLTMLVRTLDESGQAEAATQAREVATKLRAVVGDLRLPILDDLGAGAALEWLVERVEPLAGGQVKLERSDEKRPPANVELAVFRVAQEAINNAIKHGKPPIAVRYDVNADGRVTLAIDDAGPGIGSDAAEQAPSEGHFGLANMQQRAEQIGGLLDVRRWPAGGTRVALEWRPQ
jgi:signal transduction histidine kinase